MTKILRLMTAAAAGIAAIGAFAVEPVEYYDPVGGTNATCSVYTEYDEQTDLSSGWYVVSGANTNGVLIAVSGDVNLVLRDGAELVAMNGVYVIEGCSLTIWAQSIESVAGKLTATGVSNSAGIGGLNRSAGGSVTINGGVVTAKGGSGGAGIGGGYQGAGVTVTINGGEVTAIGGSYGAAIGAGIGGSDNGSLDITGMKVGRVNGGTVDWVLPSERESLCRNTNGTTVRIEVCEHHDSDKNGFCDYCGSPLYYDTVGGTNAICLVYTEYAGQTELPSGWYVVSGIISNDTRITVNGDVNLILCDNSELAAMEGVEVSSGNNYTNSLTIWAQSTNSVAGKLTATTGDENCAGIGGGENRAGGTVTINGGVVTAKGGECGAGIGGGKRGLGGTVTINGGVVTATGSFGAGIGGGSSESGGNVTINAGTVTAFCGSYGSYGAGIGGGNQGAGGNVTINGGVVTVTGGDGGAGIGGGNGGLGGTVTINGGEVVATGFRGGAGIGGGAVRSGVSVTINGGVVTATGDGGGAGVGGGYWGGGGKVTINGGVVMATGGRGGAAIGAGSTGSVDGSLEIASGMEVGYVEDGAVTWAGADERETYCRNTDGKTVRIALAGVLVDAGGGKTVLVPMTWIESVVPESFAGALEEYVYNDAANGRKVWECYVLGLDPKEVADFRIIAFPMKADGTPDLAKIAFSPSKEDWNLVGAEPVLEGRSGLGADAGWVTVTDVSAPTSLRFFRIRVELP